MTNHLSFYWQLQALFSYVSMWVGTQTVLENVQMMPGNVCQNFTFSGLVYVVNIQQCLHTLMTTALTWTIKVVTPHSNITTVRTKSSIGRWSQTTWCLDRCFIAITGYGTKQDSSSSTSKHHTADEVSEHKNPWEDKIKQCVTQPATSQIELLLQIYPKTDKFF